MSSLVSTQFKGDITLVKKKYSDLSNIAKVELSKKNYSKWKQESLNHKGFFVIFNGFLESDILQKINGNALKLYIFFGIHSNNETGESYYSIKSISKYFKKSERTINNWISELERLNLIQRYQLQHNNVSHTLLQPYQSGIDRVTKE